MFLVDESTRSGWHPQRVDCPECEAMRPDPMCAFCRGGGMIDSMWVVHDGLHIGGELVATIECFSDDPWGPWFANVVTPAGEHERRVMNDHAAAAAWAEIAAGFRIARPASSNFVTSTRTRPREAKRASRAKARGRG